MQTLRPQDRRQGVSLLHQRQPEAGAVPSGECVNHSETLSPSRITQIADNRPQFKSVRWVVLRSETSLRLRPAGEVYGRAVARWVYTREHVVSRLLQSRLFQRYCNGTVPSAAARSLCSDYHKCDCAVFSYLLLSQRGFCQMQT